VIPIERTASHRDRLLRTKRPLAPLLLHLTVVTFMPSSRRITTCAEIP
jgi:hypothetical protein